MAITINGTTGITDVNGTAAAPAITGTDTDSGVYFGTNTVGLSTGGTEAVSIDASQNVTLKNVIPSGSSAPTNGMFLPAANTVGFATNSTERARIDSSGRLLVGTTSATLGGVDANCALFFGTNNYAVMIRVPSGTNQAIRFFNVSTAVGSIDCSSSATAYNTSSDYRLKNTIAPMTGALAKVALLKPCTYKWNVNGSVGEGFIAHELAEVCPQAVTGEKDAVKEDGSPEYQGIDTSFLVATLTAAIQEQQALITALTDRIAALEAR
jgi:hypothetical protein